LGNGERLATWIAIGVAFIAAVATSYGGLQTANQVKIELTPALVEVCSPSTGSAHPDYVFNLGYSQQMDPKLLFSPSYTAPPHLRIGECVFYNEGREALLNIAVDYSVQFKGPDESSRGINPPLPLGTPEPRGGFIGGIPPNGSKILWLVNNDPCWDAYVTEYAYVSFTLPTKVLIPNYELPGTLPPMILRASDYIPSSCNMNAPPSPVYSPGGYFSLGPRR
jgi:hypothetical protein